MANSIVEKFRAYALKPGGELVSGEYQIPGQKMEKIRNTTASFKGFGHLQPGNLNGQTLTPCLQHEMIENLS
jgi:hypothetical protein